MHEQLMPHGLSDQIFTEAPMTERGPAAMLDCEVPLTAPIPKFPEHRCGAAPPALTPQFVAIAVLLSALHGLLIYWLLVRLGIGSQAL
ncbi:hypothetical protein [Delftia tsuruhatensis]|uniref:hypothetical protein n=1 Tax=Delftia tsuruhatensis TaxID=180282 RepID=UPI0022608609|nr:hypothetical protein [Delftia tsuruhatensis]MCX7506630.1 hypothetical protein [Delftia tsuruhatensis]